MILVIKKLFGKSNIVGITLFPFIILKSKLDKKNSILINHEKIHLKQQLELFVIPFYIWYVIEFFVRWLQYKNTHRAYMEICFEREAYSNEKDLNYIKNRKWYSFLKYLKR